MEKKPHGMIGKQNRLVGEKPRKKISLRVDEADLERWKSKAESLDMTFTQLVENSLNQYCEKN